MRNVAAGVDIRRAKAFVTVGVFGFVLQVAILGALTSLAGWSYALATMTAVAVTVVHNFLWHERWTWGDRAGATSGRWRRLLKFVLTTGLTSIAGNLGLTAIGVELFGLHVVAANAGAVAAMTIANYTASDRWVFVRGALVVCLVVTIPFPAAAADLKPETIAAWDQYVAGVEQRFPHPSVAEPGPEGVMIDVPSGAIHHWRGATIVRGTTVERVVQRLMHPGTPPPQEDVLESRVLSRSGNSLRVYLKLSRTALVTVVYDTEHDVSFQRRSPGLATSRSVATRIEESGGGDRGFLWRLNSYWTYTQTGNDVRIDLESVSLSREVPWIARSIVRSVGNRIARESLMRTLESVRKYLAVGPKPDPAYE